MCWYPFLLREIFQEEVRVIRTSGEIESSRDQRCSLLCLLNGRARRKLEQRQPQIAHFDEDAVERRLVTDLTRKQGRAISILRDREVVKPCLPEGIQVSLDTNDVSHTLVLRSDDVSSSTKKDTMRILSPWRGAARRGSDGSQKATLPLACIGAILARPTSR